MQAITTMVSILRNRFFKSTALMLLARWSFDAS